MAGDLEMSQKLQSTADSQTRDVRYILWFFYIVISLAILSVGCYNHGREAVTPLLWAFACLACGLLTGFLFGIPKILQGDAKFEKIDPSKIPDNQKLLQNSAYRQQVNTNLTEISDWLTKIIVGLGLINLKEIPQIIKQAANVLAKSMHDGGPDQNHLAYAVSIIVGFSIFGFLFGYIMTRMYLAGAFMRADTDAANDRPVPKLSDGDPDEKIPDNSGAKPVDQASATEVRNLLAESPPQKGSTDEQPEYYLRHSAERDSSLDRGDLRYYRLKFWLDAELPSLLDDVQKVTYVLHPTFQNPIREIADRPTNFQLNTIAWGEFTLQAVVYFKNKPPVKLERYIDFPKPQKN